MNNITDMARLAESKPCWKCRKATKRGVELGGVVWVGSCEECPLPDADSDQPKTKADGVNAKHYVVDGDAHAPAFETMQAAAVWSKATKGYKEAYATCTCGNFWSHDGQ